MPTSRANKGVPDPIDVAVGGRIRTRRRWVSFSQTDLARALGITFQQVQKYERGTNRVSASMLVRTARALDTTVGALVGEDAGGVPLDNGLLDAPRVHELLKAWRRLNGQQQSAFLAAISATGEPDQQP